MKEYSLFLDESGNFDSDIDNKAKNECLVSGFYIEGNPDSKLVNEPFVRKEILKSWYSAVDTLTSSENHAFNNINHATSIKRGKFAYQLAPVALDIFYKMEKNGANFTIFENNRRAHLIDSNTLYLNILAEGVIDTKEDIIIFKRQLKNMMIPPCTIWHYAMKKDMVCFQMMMKH